MNGKVVPILAGSLFAISGNDYTILIVGIWFLMWSILGGILGYLDRHKRKVFSMTAFLYDMLASTFASFTIVSLLISSGFIDIYGKPELLFGRILWGGVMIGVGSHMGPRFVAIIIGVFSRKWLRILTGETDDNDRPVKSRDK